MDSEMAKYSDSTDVSISKSTTISLSEDTAYSSDDENLASDLHNNKRRRRKRKVNTLLMPPEAKLEHFQKICCKLQSQKQNEKLLDELMKIPPLARMAYGENDWRYAAGCSELAEGYLELGYSAQSVKHAEKARDVIMQGGQAARNQGDHSKSFVFLKISEIYLILGRSYHLSNRYDDAENALNKSWLVACKRSTAETRVEVDDSRRQEILLRIKHAMAEVHVKQKKPQMALKCLMYVKETITSQEGGKSRKLLPVYKMMAKAEKMKQKRDHDLVVECCKEAHIIASESTEVGSDEMADTALSLAQAYLCFDEEFAFKAAETYLNEALQLYTEAHDKEHPKVLKTRDVMCKLLIRMQREDEAITLLRNLIKVKVRVHGDYSTQVAETYKLLGSVRLSQGNFKEAHKNIRRCYEIEEKIHGKSHWKTKSTEEVLNLVSQTPEISSAQEAGLKDRPHFNTVIRPKK